MSLFTVKKENFLFNLLMEQTGLNLAGVTALLITTQVNTAELGDSQSRLNGWSSYHANELIQHLQCYYPFIYSPGLGFHGRSL